MFAVISTPPLVIQLAPPPSVPGTLEIIVVLNPGPLDSTSSSDLLYIPDNMGWIAKWGALSDLLLREGLAYDETRGQYAQFRYDLGVKVAAMHRVLVQTQISGVSSLPSSVTDMDTYSPGWQCVTGISDTALTLGQNLLALSPVPDGQYNITCDVVRNAPIPELITDYLQLGRQDLDVVLGYAEHLAAFKMGGAEFLATIPLFDAFIKQASKYNRRLRELDDFILTELKSIIMARPQANPLALGDEV